MAVFGRKTARQRLRRATQQALSVPTFRTSMDCTPWVLGGLWPAELQRVTPETALLAEYLKKDLQRIADSANERLRAVSEAGLDERVRQSEESRVINVARAFAVLRVESTVRQLRREPLGFQPQLLGLTGSHSSPVAVVEVAPEPEPVREPTGSVKTGRHHRDNDESDAGSDGDEQVVADSTSAEADEPAGDEIGGDEEEPTAERVEPQADTPRPDPVTVEPAAPEAAPEPRPAETEQLRLKRLVRFVARQEPGLRWAAGLRDDGTTVLVTDLAHGWIPPGVDLPEGVELLTPRRRSGNAASLLGSAEEVATYAPGDPFGSFRDRDKTPVSAGPRRLEEIDDLPHAISDATRQRDGLPRLTHALASAGTSGGPVIAAEVDVLRVHLDTARYQLLAQYPDPDNALLLNCLLLAATEALVTADLPTANYHFAWFRVLNGQLAGRWASDR